MMTSKDTFIRFENKFWSFFKWEKIGLLKHFRFYEIETHSVCNEFMITLSLEIVENIVLSTSPFGDGPL